MKIRSLDHLNFRRSSKMAARMRWAECNQFEYQTIGLYLAGILAKVIKGLRQLTNLPPLSSIKDISTVQVYRCSMWLCTDSQSREEGESGSIPLFSASLLKYYTKHKTHLTREGLFSRVKAVALTDKNSDRTRPPVTWNRVKKLLKYHQMWSLYRYTCKFMTYVNH